MNLSRVEKEEHGFRNSYVEAKRKETYKGSRKGERKADGCWGRKESRN